MLENRPIVNIAIGYILGIIVGLYCKISIVFLYLPILTFIYVINNKLSSNKFKLISFKRYFRYVKIIFKSRVIIIIIISSIISNTNILYQNYKFDNLYKGIEEISGIATIVSNVKEKEYKNIYKIKYKQTFLYLNTAKNIKLNYGDKIRVNGIYKSPSIQKNYGGFNYKEYLKTLKIYGTIEAKKIEKIESAKNNSIFVLSNNVFLEIKNLIQNNFEKDIANILLGITLGYTDEIDEEIKNSFSESNISHILAVSGMHVGIIAIFIKIIFEKILGKKNMKIFTILILLFYMFITGFSVSVVRACIMISIMLCSYIFYRKNDVWQSLCFALILQLIYNPFLLKSASFLLTFLGTIGIILKPKNLKSIISITFFVTLAIMPVMAISFNKIAVFSLIISMIIGFLVSPLILASMLYLLEYSIFKLDVGLKIIISFLTRIVIEISELGEALPLNKIYVITPSILVVCIYYFSLIVRFMFISCV